MQNSKRWATRALAAGIASMLVLPGQALEREGPFLRGRMPVAAPAGAVALCRDLAWACAASSPADLTEKQIAHAKRVNSAVNRGVREVTDQSQYGIAERWALPTRRGGDCEDFALLKKRELVASGLPPQRLLLATALDRRRNPHVVLVLRTPQGDLILDNLTEEVVRWSQTGYTFLRMQDPAAPSGWTALVG